MQSSRYFYNCGVIYSSYDAYISFNSWKYYRSEGLWQYQMLPPQRHPLPLSVLIAPQLFGNCVLNNHNDIIYVASDWGKKGIIWPEDTGWSPLGPIYS